MNPKSASLKNSNQGGRGSLFSRSRRLGLSFVLVFPHLMAAAAGFWLLLALSPTAAQAIPQLLNYQGRLTDSNNIPRNGTFSMVFTIYDAASVGNVLWTETQNSVSVVNGVFSVQLGSQSSLPFSVFIGDNAYLEVQVSGETLAPRQRLIAASYAFNAGMLAGNTSSFYLSTAAVDQTVLGNKTFSGTLAVPTPTLSGQAATKGYVDNLTGGGLAAAVLSATQTFSGTNTFNQPVTMVSSAAISGTGLSGPTPLFLVGSNKLAVLANGNVGLGTLAPTYNLNVVGNALVTSSMAVSGSGLSGTNPVFQVEGGTMTVLANGNVGLGTPNPTAMLHFYSPSTVANPNMRILIEDADSSGASSAIGLEMKTRSSDFLVDSDDSVNAFRIKDMNAGGGTARIYIDSAGKVGINQSSPAGQFEVGGGTLTALNGSVGVGTAGPQTGTAGSLTVAGSVFFGTGGSYKVTSGGAATLAASTVGDLTKNATAMFFGTNGGASGEGDEFVFYDGAPGAGTRLLRISANGHTVALGAFTGNTAPDLAEYIQASRDVEAADVVSASPEETHQAGPGSERIQVMKSARAYDSKILGVISDGSSTFEIKSHMHSINGDYPGKPLVLAGRVPVKVTGENGPIAIGDYLTSSSKPGYAMKATEPGPTVGIALENFDGKGTGKVLCYVHIGERNVAQKMRELEEENKEIKARLDNLQEMIRPRLSSK